MSDGKEREPAAHEITILRVGTVLAHALGAAAAVVLLGAYLAVRADRVSPGWVLVSAVAALIGVAALGADVMRHSFRPASAPWLPAAVWAVVAAVVFN